MRRAGWSSWRACLLWGIATLIVSQSFALFMPAALAHPVPGSSISNPVLAFEFARIPAHLDAVFGLPGDALRPDRIAGMMRGNVLDYLFMAVYGSFVLGFFGAIARETGNPRWWLAGSLGPLATVSDAIENALLLSINADMATPGPELAVLHYPVWIKFTALALACGFAAWALFRRGAWLPALLHAACGGDLVRSRRALSLGRTGGRNDRARVDRNARLGRLARVAWSARPAQ